MTAPVAEEHVNDRFAAILEDVNRAQIAALQITANYRLLLVVATFTLTIGALICPPMMRWLDPGVVVIKPAAASSAPSASPATPSAGASPTASPTPPGPTTGTVSPTPTGPGSTPTPGPPTSATTPPEQPPAASTVITPGKLIGTIEFWGAVGGLIGAVATLWGMRGSVSPVGLQLAQLAIKLPAGAWAALAGVVLLQSKLLPFIQPATTESIAAYAIIFGAGQQAITGFIDRRASELVDKSKSANENTVT